MADVEVVAGNPHSCALTIAEFSGIAGGTPLDTSTISDSAGGDVQSVVLGPAAAGSQLNNLGVASLGLRDGDATGWITWATETLTTGVEVFSSDSSSVTGAIGYAARNSTAGFGTTADWSGSAFNLRAGGIVATFLGSGTPTPVQFKSFGSTNKATNFPLDFDTAPQNGNLVVVSVIGRSATADAPWSILDSLGGAWTEVEGALLTGFGYHHMWYRIVAGQAGGPTLSAPALSGATTTTLDGQVTTDTTGAGSTVYSVLTTSSTQPTEAQIKAGQDHTGAALPAGQVRTVADPALATVNLGTYVGLSSATQYWMYVVQEDPTGGDTFGNIVSATETTLNANPVITEQLTITAVNSATVDHQMTATDADDPNVEYLVAYYPNGTGAAVTDAQLADDCRNAPAGGGVPSPNPRGALWARSVTQTQATQLVDTATGLVPQTTYDVEAGVADSVNPTVRGTAQNITMGFKTCTQANPWKNADGTDIGALAGIAWRWKDTALGAYTDNGTVDIDATGNWVTNIEIANSTLNDGQTGYLEAEQSTRLQVYRYLVSSTPGSVN